MDLISKIPLFGDVGEDVTALQKALSAYGFSPGKIDGIFGGKTRSAVSAFQKSIGLAGSGIPGPKTIAALDLFIDKQVPNEPIEILPHETVKSPRKLLPALEALIDKQVVKKYYTEFSNAYLAKDYLALMVICARAMDDLKIREATNKNDGYMVEMIQKVSGGHKGYAWCMYAVQVCVAWVEVKTGKVSKLYSSGSCEQVRRLSPKELVIPSANSMHGCIWVWIYSSTGMGHTGVFDKWFVRMSQAQLYEGNTSQGYGPDGKIDREGGGFYKTKRAYVISGMKLGLVLNPFASEEV